MPIPLKILICDKDLHAIATLQRTLETFPDVLSVDQIDTIAECKSKFSSGDYNTIFVDPLTLGLEEASFFIFQIRKSKPHIVFVLYLDRNRAERERDIFYHGERRRFSHYYTLDKNTPLSAFGDEVFSMLRTCQEYLSWNNATASLELVKIEAKKFTKNDKNNDLAHFKAAIDNFTLVTRMANELYLFDHTQTPTVFISHRFAEIEYITGITKLLEDNGFRVLTGNDLNSYIGRSVIDRIRSASFFLCLMTCADQKTDGTFTTSSWLLEEKGVALALNKPLVLMVEEGVSDFGSLQGDWQRIHFGPKGFLKAALEAVTQLKSYIGKGEKAL